MGYKRITFCNSLIKICIGEENWMIHRAAFCDWHFNGHINILLIEAIKQALSHFLGTNQPKLRHQVANIYTCRPQLHNFELKNSNTENFVRIRAMDKKDIYLLQQSHPRFSIVSQISKNFRCWCFCGFRVNYNWLGRNLSKHLALLNFRD